MNRFMLCLGAVLALFSLVTDATAQCGNRQVDQTNLLLGQSLSSQALTSNSGCQSCQQGGQALTAAPAPNLQMFTLPTPQRAYVMTPPQSNILYMTSSQQGSASTAASTSSASASASASAAPAPQMAYSLPLVSSVAPVQVLSQNSTACASNGCGRSGLLQRAFSRIPRPGRTRSVSRSFSSTTTVN